ncbi:hypothetical protein N7922_00525 [Kosakonia sp. ML.JS2a]|uniref:hypothetical protein n=1 Tax=Kosakonia sp. ML.JS2a TaxID=2980557 RepID=UPI0021DA2818|nr:hypothetical protein [Kosakonia sp. ML.JS2a]UXY11052.1 hypothetical protein N7922_00525 [Kosakonia sp. ML.JS2a]
MEKYTGIIAIIGPLALIGFFVFYMLQGYFLYLKIKKDPVYVKAQIVSYFPRTPNELGKVDIVMTYSFRADNKTYTKDKQTLNINTVDLDKYNIGKEVPVVYYRGNPDYSRIDVYDKSLRN